MTGTGKQWDWSVEGWEYAWAAQGNTAANAGSDASNREKPKGSENDQPLPARRDPRDATH
ncbi:MAG TPA: hypothetical protein VGN16_19315 [Acidobacteriaceae bacterium]